MMKTNQHYRVSVAVIFTLVFSVLIPQTNFSQDKFLKIKGKVLKRYDQKRLKKKVVISTISSCGDTNTVQTDNGRYKIYLSPGCNYEVHYNSNDYVDKHFRVEALDIPKNVRDKNFSLPVDIMMVRKVDDLDTSIFKYAQGKAFYHKVLKNFVWDPDFTSKAIIRADSVLVNIGAQDTIQKIEKEEVQSKPKNEFEPLYLFIMQKNIPSNKIIQNLEKPKLKPLTFDTIQKGIFWADMNLFFIEKNDEGLRAYCQYFSERECSKSQAMKIIDNQPKAFTNPLFSSGVYLEKLYWLSQKGIFKYPDFLQTINKLDQTLHLYPPEKETDAILSFKADMKKIVSLFETIKNHNLESPEDYQQTVDQFINLIQQVKTNF